MMSTRSSFLFSLVIALVIQLVASFQYYKLNIGRRCVMSQLQSTSADSEMNWDPTSGPKLDFDEDYYSVLDVAITVDAKELKKAYYKLVFKYHPDNIENENTKSLCNKQMMVINGAYKILKNINLRILYDRQRRKGFTGAKAGIKESSVNNDGSRPVSAPKPPAPEKKKAPPKPAEPTRGETKKYGGAGFGGSWAASDESDDSEEEFNDQERERERQRQRYQEPQPQTQRQRDQQTRDRDREFDFTYEQDGDFTQPNRTPWGFNTNTQKKDTYQQYERPVRPSDRFVDNDIDDINNVEDFLRRTGSGASDVYDDNVMALKRKLENLCAKKVRKEREMDIISASVRDWGEVTDVRIIRKRIEDINEIKSLTQQVSELADEIADSMLRSRIPSSTYRPNRSPPQTGYRPPVDLWGESPRSSIPPPTRPAVKRVTPPRSSIPTSKPIPGSVNWDIGRNAVKGESDYIYNFDEETLEDFGGKKDEGEATWRSQYEGRRNPNGADKAQAFASFLFEDEPTVEDRDEDEEEEEEEENDDEDGEVEGSQNSAVLNELLRLFKMSKKG